MSRNFIKVILVLRWPLLLGLTLLTLILGLLATRVQIDPTTESLFQKTSEDYQFYRQFSEKFGSDHMIAIAMETPDLFTDENLNVLKEMTDELAIYDPVERVMSLTNAEDIQPRMIGVRVVPVMKRFFAGKDTAEEVRQKVLNNELYLNNLVSRDGTVANILIYMRGRSDDRSSRGRFIKGLYRYVKLQETATRKFYMAGAPIEQYEFIRYIRKDQSIFVPMIALLLIITTWLIYRHLVCVVLSMAIVFTTLIWTMGTISILGQDINLVTSLLAPVVMIVAVVNAIHLMNLFFEIRAAHPSLRESIILTMTQLSVPCFLSHFTTILGFASLAFNPVPAIQSFGIYAALGTFYSYCVEILLTPILLPLLPYRVRDEELEEQHILNRALVSFLERIEFKGKWWIIGGCTGLILFSCLGISRIEVDTSLVRQMDPNSRLAKATRFIDDRLTGVYVLGYVLSRRDGGTLDDPDSLRQIDQFKQFMEDMPEIVKVNTITTVIKRINQAREGGEEGYEIPEDKGRLKSYFKKLLASEDPVIAQYITEDLTETRLEARMKAVGTREGAAVEEKSLQYLADNLAGDFHYRLTGSIVLLGHMAKNLVANQMKGFLFAFMSIVVLIALIFRSVRMGLLAAIPNLFPILTVYGLMGFLLIELSSATAMISSIVLGMVVDASIHFLHRFKLEFTRRRHYLQALHHTFRNVGMSLIISTVILTAGFASSIFASFRPTVYLGVFTALTIFFALIFTLVILPVCLVMMRPFGPQSTFSPAASEVH